MSRISPLPRKVTRYDVDDDTEDEDGLELTELSTSRLSHSVSDSEDDGSNEREQTLLDKARRGSASTMQSFMLYTPDEERRVRRKFDRHLVLFVAFLYMLSFLDRSNIGNARIAGMSSDLHLNSSQFEWLLRAFYITYISFEWMTLLWKVFPAHIYLTICVCSWGVIASLQSLATSFSSMLILRALLGVGEAAFVGIPFYMSFFFKRDELAFRTGLFISAAPLATSFAGTLAWCITRVGDTILIASWRMLLLVEGFPSVVVAVFVYYNIPDRPEEAKFLRIRERKVAKIRLRKERDTPRPDGQASRLKWSDIHDTLTDPKVYLTAAMFFSCNVAFSSLPVFLPTIIEDMGYTALRSQALSAPPHLAAFIAVLVTAYLSDRARTRSPFVIFHALLAAAGYLIMATCGSLQTSAHWRYLGVYPATIGFFSAITIIITWTLNNQHSSTGRGTGLAMLNYIGQLGPLLGVHLYPKEDGPYYVKGMSICAGFMASVAILAIVLRICLTNANRRTSLANQSSAEEDEDLIVDERKGKGARMVFMV